MWRIFRQLSAARGSGMMGPQALTFSDIDAWQRLYRLRLTPWEVDVLRELDDVLIAHYATRAAERKKK